MNNKILGIMMALIVILYMVVYGIVLGPPYIAWMSWIVLIGILALGAIELGSRGKHGKEVG